MKKLFTFINQLIDKLISLIFFFFNIFKKCAFVLLVKLQIIFYILFYNCHIFFIKIVIKVLLLYDNLKKLIFLNYHFIIKIPNSINFYIINIIPARFNFFYYFLICFFKQKKENFFLYLTTIRGLRILYTYRFTRRLGIKWDLMVKKCNDFLFITARDILIFQVKFFGLQLNILNFYIDYNNNPNKIDFYKNLTYVKEFNNTCLLYKNYFINYMQKFDNFFWFLKKVFLVLKYVFIFLSDLIFLSFFVYQIRLRFYLIKTHYIPRLKYYYIPRWRLIYKFFRKSFNIFMEKTLLFCYGILIIFKLLFWMLMQIIPYIFIFLKSFLPWFFVFVLIIVRYTYLYIFTNPSNFLNIVFSDISYYLNFIKFYFKKKLNLFIETFYVKIKKTSSYINKNNPNFWGFFFLDALYFFNKFESFIKKKLKTLLFVLYMLYIYNKYRKNVHPWTLFFEFCALIKYLLHIEYWTLWVAFKMQLCNVLNYTNFSILSMVFLFLRSLLFFLNSFLFVSTILLRILYKFIILLLVPYFISSFRIWKKFWFYSRDVWKIIKEITSPSLFILKPEISSIVSIFNRIFSTTLYFYFYICIFFYVWQNFTVFFDYLFILLFIYLLFYHIFYSRIKLNLFINNLIFLIGNNFKLINFIHYFFFIILVLFSLFFSYIILHLSFIENCYVSGLNIVNNFATDFIDQFYLINNLNSHFWLIYPNIALPLLYYAFFGDEILAIFASILHLFKPDLLNFNFILYFFIIFFLKTFSIFLISLFCSYDKTMLALYNSCKLKVLNLFLIIRSFRKCLPKIYKINGIWVLKTDFELKESVSMQSPIIDITLASTRHPKHYMSNSFKSDENWINFIRKLFIDFFLTLLPHPDINNFQPQQQYYYNFFFKIFDQTRFRCLTYYNFIFNLLFFFNISFYYLHNNNNNNSNFLKIKYYILTYKALLLHIFLVLGNHYINIRNLKITNFYIYIRRRFRLFFLLRSKIKKIIRFFNLRKQRQRKKHRLHFHKLFYDYIILLHHSYVFTLKGLAIHSVKVPNSRPYNLKIGYRLMRRRSYYANFKYAFVNTFINFKVKTGDISYFLYKCFSQFFFLIILTICFFLLFNLYLLFFESMDLGLNLDFYEIVSHFISEYDYSAPAPLFDESSEINLDSIFNNIFNTSQNVVDIIFLPECKNCLIFYPDDACIRNNINLNFKFSDHVYAIDAKLKNATSNSTLSYFFLFYINALYLYFYLICSIFLILLYVHLVLNFSNILKDYINIIDVFYFNLLNFFFRVTFFLFFLTKIIFWFDIAFIYYINNITLISILYIIFYFIISIFTILNNYLNRQFLYFLYNYNYIKNISKYLIIIIMLFFIGLFLYFIFFSTFYFAEFFNIEKIIFLKKTFNLNCAKCSYLLNYDFFFKDNLKILNLSIDLYYLLIDPLFYYLSKISLLFNTILFDISCDILNLFLLFWFNFVIEYFFLVINNFIIFCSCLYFNFTGHFFYFLIYSFSLNIISILDQTYNGILYVENILLDRVQPYVFLLVDYISLKLHVSITMAKILVFILWAIICYL